MCNRGDFVLFVGGGSDGRSGPSLALGEQLCAVRVLDVLVLSSLWYQNLKRAPNLGRGMERERARTQASSLDKYVSNY